MRMSKSRNRERKKTYLGLPSSGVPDLKGKQEHSQQKAQVHNTDIRLVEQTDSGRRMENKTENGTEKVSLTQRSFCFSCAV